MPTSLAPESTKIFKTKVNYTRFTKSLVSSIGLWIGILASILLYFATACSIENEAKIRFEHLASNTYSAIHVRLRDYSDVLLDVGALFSTSEELSRQQFHDYVVGLNLRHRYPGIQSINFASYVKADNKTAFETKVRQDASLMPGGYPNFAVKPAGKRAAYYVMTYLEPMENSPLAFGLDIASNPNVAAALEMSRDTGHLISSGKLIQVDGPNRHIGLAMRLPIYRRGKAITTVDEKRNAYIGSIGAGFNVMKLMQGVIDDAMLRTIHFDLYDAGVAGKEISPFIPSAENLLFSSDTLSSVKIPPSNRGDFFTSTYSMEVGGRTWKTYFSARKSAMLTGADPAIPWLVLTAGLLSSFLLYSIYYSLNSSRRRAIEIARSITKELRKSEANLTEAQQMARLGNWSLEKSSGKMIWSDETYRILGLTSRPKHTKYANFIQHIHEQDRTLVNEAVEHVFNTGKEFQGEYRIMHPDGSIRWVETILRAVANTENHLLRGTLIDISAKKQVILQSEIEHKISRLAASYADAELIMPKIIEALCVGMGWSCGVYRVLIENKMRLQCVYTWSASTLEATIFLEEQKNLQIATGSGIAGKAWVSHCPIIDQDTSNHATTRMAANSSADIRSSIAFPVMAGKRVLGIMECFGKSVPTEEDLFDFVQTVGCQISQYLQRKSAEDALQQVASIDLITNLPSRSMLIQMIDNALLRNTRYYTGVAVLVIRIDGLNNENIRKESIHASEHLLQECVRRLLQGIRASDMVARIDQSEFGVIVEQFTEPADVSVVAKKLLHILETPFLLNDQEYMLKTSIGISTFPDDGTDAELLLKSASKAMGRARTKGSNHQFYSAPMNEHSFARLAMETSLRQAIERKEFLLYFQPRLDIKSNSVTVMEALLRWQHPEWGLVLPGQFLSMAEESGLAMEIGQLVVKRACTQGRLWQQQDLPIMRLSVNFSEHQFYHKRFINEIMDALHTSGFPPENLELEITERTIMKNPELAIKLMNQIKILGVHLSINDFGTGHSSLEYLRRLPVDSIKISQSFTKDIPNNTENSAIAKSILTLCQSLRLKIVATGIQTAEQYRFFEAHDCNEIQGHFISEPLPAEKIISFLKKNIQPPLVT